MNRSACVAWYLVSVILLVPTPGKAQEYPVDFTKAFAEQVVDSVPRLLVWPARSLIPGLDSAHGSIRIGFVVDQQGRIEPRTIELLGVTDSTALTPAAAFLAGTRFRPGRFATGRLVRTYIQREIVVWPDSMVLRGPLDTTVVRW